MSSLFLCDTYRLLNEVFILLLCTVFLLNAAVFADLALYLSVGGLASVELSCSPTTLVLQARLEPIPRLPIFAVWTFSRSLSLSSSSVVSSRSPTSYLATALRLSTALLSARGRASACSGPWLRAIIWVICACLCTCGVTAVFCATLISS